MQIAPQLIITTLRMSSLPCGCTRARKVTLRVLRVGDGGYILYLMRPSMHKQTSTHVCGVPHVKPFGWVNYSEKLSSHGPKKKYLLLYSSIVARRTGPTWTHAPSLKDDVFSTYQRLFPLPPQTLTSSSFAVAISPYPATGLIL